VTGQLSIVGSYVVGSYVVGSYVASWAINLFGELGQQVSVYVRGVTGDERSLGVTLCSTVSEGFAVA
jgi:hypothetical protein